MNATRRQDSFCCPKTASRKRAAKRKVRCKYVTMGDAGEYKEKVGGSNYRVPWAYLNGSVPPFAPVTEAFHEACMAFFLLQ